MPIVLSAVCVGDSRYQCTHIGAAAGLLHWRDVGVGGEGDEMARNARRDRDWDTCRRTDRFPSRLALDATRRDHVHHDSAELDAIYTMTELFKGNFGDRKGIRAFIANNIHIHINS